MTTYGMLLLGVLSLLQIQPRPLILDTNMIGQERTFVVGQTWSMGFRAWIADTDTMMIDGQLHTHVEVGAQSNIMTSKYVWALGYGLLYFATLGTTPDGLFYFEYIDKKHINALLQRPIGRWKSIPQVNTCPER